MYNFIEIKGIEMSLKCVLKLSKIQKYIKSEFEIKKL
jgi:hypothetical protein